jgi:hypothetical protein
MSAPRVNYPQGVNALATFGWIGGYAKRKGVDAHRAIRRPL